jgi:hypothetical protein
MVCTRSEKALIYYIHQMKAILPSVLSLLFGTGLNACSSIYVAVTDNPVGNKVGQSAGYTDASIGQAALDGNIQEIGTIKFQITGKGVEYIVTGN